MDSQQAKEILALYRPGIDDLRDPFFVEALAQVQRDPQLSHWLESQRGLDAALRRKFKQIDVPSGLGRRILSERNVIRPAIWRERRLLVAAAAAAIVLAVMAGYLLRPPGPRNFGAYRAAMARLVSGEYKMMLQTNDLAAVRQFLAANHSPADYVLSKQMEKLPAEGGALVDWDGRRVSLICIDRGADNDLFLFIIDRSALLDPPATQTTQFARVGGMTTVSWSRGDETYVLAAKDNEENLRKLL